MNTRIAFVDIDGTLVIGQTQVLLIKYLYKKKLIKAPLFLRVLIWYALYSLLSKPIDEKMVEGIYKKLLKDKTKEEVFFLLNDFYTSVLDRKIYPEAGDLINKMKTQKYKVVLFSATIDPIADYLSKKFGADDYLCTNLDIKKNIYTGKIKGGINHGSKKLKNMKALLKKEKINKKNSAVLTDHYTDLELLKFCGEPIAVNPDKKLENFAKKANWEIIKL